MIFLTYIQKVTIYNFQSMTTTFSSINRSNLDNSSFKNAKQNFPARIEVLSQSLSEIQKHMTRLGQQQQSIREAKINVQRYLDQKSQQNKERLLNQLKRYQDEVKKKIQSTRSETQKIDQKIDLLKDEQLQALQLILGIQRRVQELQVQLGVDTQ